MAPEKAIGCGPKGIHHRGAEDAKVRNGFEFGAGWWRPFNGAPWWKRRTANGERGTGNGERARGRGRGENDKGGS